ncbi:MAG: DNA recombination protein RmuC, partial [Muribaculaceae bacterium]|nr:DNA recombination protein RmuC [Muribaculaceae bacterium]
MIIAIITLSIALIAAIAIVLGGRKSTEAKTAEIARLSAENGRLTGENAAFAKIRQDLEASMARLQTQIEELRRSEAEAVSEKVRLAERNEALVRENERIQKEQARLEAELEERFRNLAAKVLVSNSEVLREQNRTGLAEVLAPMRENLEQFRTAFTERYDKESAERFSLGERVRELVQLNQTIGLETRKLSDALRGNSKVQGDWGEMILDNILERSGFRRGYEYLVQESVTDAEGHRLRPDVVINYTEGRKRIIDSKGSIQDYLRMVNAESDDQRDRFARSHLASVKKHIAELKGKSYQDVVGDERVDFVLMFIPHEGAFLAAMKLDESLWQTAFDSRVLVISPTHLMSVIRLVEQVWRHAKQNRNALEIARQAGLMLDKFNGFLADMERIEKSLGAAGDACRNA